MSARKEPVSERFEEGLREPSRFVLRLFVAGTAPSSLNAVARTREICDQYLLGQYELEIIDVHQHPGRAEEDDVFAIPTLLRALPEPLRKISGDLSDEGRVLVALGVEPKSPAGL